MNRIHAILGASDQCIATYPGDMAVAMSALGARVETEGPTGKRNIKVREFHRLPGDTPEIDNVLEPGEIITGVILPPPVGGANSTARYATAPPMPSLWSRSRRLLL